MMKSLWRQTCFPVSGLEEANQASHKQEVICILKIPHYYQPSTITELQMP